MASARVAPRSSQIGQIYDMVTGMPKNMLKVPEKIPVILPYPKRPIEILPIFETPIAY